MITFKQFLLENSEEDVSPKAFAELLKKIVPFLLMKVSYCPLKSCYIEV